MNDAPPITHSKGLLDYDEDGFAAALEAAGAVTLAALSRARRACRQSGARLDHALLELGLISEADLTAFFANWRGLEIAGREAFGAEPAEGFEEIGAFLKRAEIAPVSGAGDPIRVAFADPFQPETVEALAFRFDRGVAPMLATRSAIRAALAAQYGGVEAKPGDEADGAAADEDLEKLRSLANDGPVVKFVADVIRDGIDARATDIHFEALESELLVRFRTKGQLGKHLTAPGAMRAAAASRLKVMAGLNISERRRPQDGRFDVSHQGRKVDIRMSALPTQYGESIVLRILDRAAVALDWDALAVPPETATEIERITRLPNGLFLVTGPTGSGKTTTLYTALSKLNAEEVKIFTVEDPIEYSLPGINQVQVHPEIGLTFGVALRAVLRQDPNVIMIGEIRDAETAENAVRAAMVGRMVMATMHVSTPEAAIERMVDLGASRKMLEMVLKGVVGQRRIGSRVKNHSYSLLARK